MHMTHLPQCRQDNNSHMGPAYSAQFQGLESAIKVSPNTTFFYPIKLKNYTRRIKSRFSEVLRTSPYPSQKIQLILTILTAVSLFPYLFWGTRNGSCRFSVYMLFLGIPWSYPDVLYIAGKTFLRGIQRSWNRGKRFSGDGVIRETSLTIMAHRGGIRSGALNRPSGGPGGDVRIPSTLPGTLEKGGPSFILEFSTGVQSNLGHDKAKSYFVYISPSMIWISAKRDIYGKLRLRRTQRRRLQEVWTRTRQGRRVLREDQLFRLDKRY